MSESWKDKKPTEMQISTLYNWFAWAMPTPEAAAAAKWAGGYATRGEMSQEMQRIHALKQRPGRRLLTQEECFDAPVWRRYEEYLRQKARQPMCP